MANDEVRALEVFKGTVEVMLLDGILTREEKRLIIKLSNQLGLTQDEPALIYQSIRDGTEIEGGRVISKPERLRIFERIYEVALVNESLSRDEWRVIKHLREQFNISQEELEKIASHLREIVKERFDKNVVDKMLGTLKDSVSLVGSLFDTVRTKKA